MTMASRRGVFITFEGGEGAGKSTQLRAVSERLRAAGHDVVTTREPGGSAGAEALREFLLFGRHDLSTRAEVMAHFAARCDHVDRLIRPALESGKIVLCDRFFDSTLAYQGYGRGEGDPVLLDLIGALRGLVGLAPDLTVLFEVDGETAQRRVEARAQASGRLSPVDRYESADRMFHQRVATGFEMIARAEPERVKRLPVAQDSIEAVTDRVLALIAPALQGG